MSYIKSMRIAQWLKNILIFIPMFTANAFSYHNFISIMYVFIFFSLIVSSTYIFNDFKDKKSDSKHPTKYKRAIASGKISTTKGYIFMLILFIFGNFFLFMRDYILIIFSLTYTILTLSYSLKLKYVKYIDILTIATLFVLRILLGSYSANVLTSIPLLLFVFFTSLGIASGKKISILNNDLISTSKIKTFLHVSYKKNELFYILKSSFQISLITYIVWIIFIKSLFLDSLGSIFLISSCIFLFVFSNIFINKSEMGLTEELIEIKTNNNDLLYSALLFGISSLIGMLI